MQLVYGEGYRITDRPYFYILNDTENDAVACQNAGHNAVDHFADVSKMVELSFGIGRQIDDIMFIRYLSPCCPQW